MKRAALGSFLLGLIAAVLVLVAVPASAHTELASSSPENGAVLDVAPTQVVLTFSEDLLPGTASVSVSDAGDVVIAEQSITVTGAVVTMPWPSDLPDGTYSVNYRVVADDGHPVSDSITFSYGGGTAASAAAIPANVAPAEAQEAAGISPATLLALAIGLTVAVVVAIAARRRGRASS